LQFHLKHITPEQIAKHLQMICHAENITHELPALDKLAKAADGSMRDALSLLDQAIAYSHGAVSTSDVHAMLGSMAQDELLPFVEALAAQDGKQLFERMTLLSERAPDFRQALEELIHLFHQIALAQIVPEHAASDAAIAQLARQLKPEDVQIYYQIALLARRDLSYTPSPQQGFEMTLLRMLAFKPASPHSERTVAPVKATAKPTQAPKTSEHVPAQTSAVIKPAAMPEQPVAANTPPPQASESAANIEWRELLPKLELTGMAYALAANCMLVSIEGDKIHLALSANHQPMLNPKLKERLVEALSRCLKRTIQLDVTISTTEISTPAKQQAQENTQRLASATQAVLDDPKIKQLIDMYDATVEVSLV
jgi:DNA polymerase-3 subunit gamma/tau